MSTVTDTQTPIRQSSSLLFRLVIFAAVIGLLSYATASYREAALKQESHHDLKGKRTSETNDIMTALLRLNDLPQDDERIIALKTRLAQIYWLDREYARAESIYLYLWPIIAEPAAAKNVYSKDWSALMLNLAGLYQDMGHPEKAQYYYNFALLYDRMHLHKHDPRIARDLNNLGLNNYLMAGVTPFKYDRQLRLDKADFYLVQALAACNNIFGPKSQNEAIVLENRYLVLRDQGRLAEAEQAKREAHLIESLIKRHIDAP